MERFVNVIFSGCLQELYQPVDAYECFLGHFFHKTLFWIAANYRNNLNSSVWYIFIAYFISRKTFVLQVLKEDIPMKFWNHLHHRTTKNFAQKHIKDGTQDEFPDS